MRCVDAVGFERIPQYLAALVVADTTNHGDRAPQTSRGDGLVGSFTTGNPRQVATEDCLAD